jgi:hypothetical protein
MNRRTFLQKSLAGSLALITSSPLSSSLSGGEASAAVDIRSLLEAEDPEVMRLVENVLRG